MAEAVSLAASVAGLVGLSGQILQGVLFLREFFEDARDAPEDVLDLRDELELFAFVARDTLGRFQDASLTGIAIEDATVVRTLERCSSIVLGIRRKLDKYAGKSKAGVIPWWARLKVAARKETMGEQLRRLERAKGLLLGLQHNLTHALLLAQYSSLQQTTSFISQVEKRLEATSQLDVRTYLHPNNSGILLDCGSQAEVQSMNPNDVHRKDNNLITMTDEDYRPSPTDVSSGGNSTTEGRAVASSQLQKWRRVSEKRLDFWLVKVELQAQEERHPNQIIPDDSQSQHSPIQQRSIQAHFRVPFFSRKIILNMQSVPFSPLGYDMQLRMRNTIREGSPILVACDNLDLGQIQELLQTRAASPFDYYFNKDWGDCSLIDRVYMSVFKNGKYIQSIGQARRAVDVLNCLLPLHRNNSQMLNRRYFTFTILMALESSHDVITSAQINLTRTILRHSKDNPFGTVHSLSLAVFIPFAATALSLPSFLLEQSYHEIEEVADPDNDNYGENDRTMLSDPEGQIMQEKIKAGHLYRFLGETIYSECQAGSIFGLLAVVLTSETPESIICCKNRLVFLLQLGFDICKPRFIGRVLDEEKMWSLVSLARYALQLGLDGFLTNLLLEVGWGREEVEDAFDEEHYHGIPELLDGKVLYSTRQECRTLFIYGLIQGEFANYDDILNISELIALNTWTSIVDVYHITVEANSSFRAKMIPGSWQEDKDKQLIPGIDFTPWIREKVFDVSEGCFRGNILDMRDWLLDDDEMKALAASTDTWTAILGQS